MLVRRVSRLAELDELGSGLRRAAAWGFVGLPLMQHPITCLGEVTGDRYDCAAMSLTWGETLIEQPDMTVAVCLDPYGAGSGFHESPLQIMVDVAACATMPDGKRGRLAVSTSVGSVCRLVWGGGYTVPRV